MPTPLVADRGSLLSLAPITRLQADHLLSLYYGEWNESVDPVYSPQFTY